ncbi:MAG: NYN domain-containing protein [Terriglobales bacterium]
MAKKIVILIDGGFIRVEAKKAGKVYNPTFIEQFAHACNGADEEILRVLYYDCAPYSGTVRLPVSGNQYTFAGSDKWLEELARKDLFAVRRGVLKFRGYKPRKTPVGPAAELTDADFSPDFEQKGVDMRIGLDIAMYSENRGVERIVLVSNDTDCVPAMKHGRKAGLQIVLIEPPGVKIAAELLMHSDFKRVIPWP